MKLIILVRWESLMGCGAVDLGLRSSVHGLRCGPIRNQPRFLLKETTLGRRNRMHLDTPRRDPNSNFWDTFLHISTSNFWGRFQFVCFHPGFKTTREFNPDQVRIIGQTQFVLLMTPSNDSWKARALGTTASLVHVLDQKPSVSFSH